MQLIFVAGSWGSGTTSVIGALDHLGIPTFGPHFKSNDPKTENTYELLAFKDLVFKFSEEKTIRRLKGYSQGFIPALEVFRKDLENQTWPEIPGGREKIFALKMPLASICLPEITQVFDTKIILVHRPIADIEATRKRRDWPAHLGAMGAQQIYMQFLDGVFAAGLNFLGVSYNDFKADPHKALSQIIDFCDIKEFSSNIDRAAGFVRR